MDLRQQCHLFSLIVALTICPPIEGAEVIIGGFNTGRVGDASITQGPLTEELRAAISNAFPGATFASTGTLTPAFLSTVNFLIVGAPTVTSPTSLSSVEQTNLLNYVTVGGGAFIFSENDSYAGVPTSDQANETFLDPFGVDSTGTIQSATMATVSNPTHPVMSGPFGPVTSVSTYYPGWFDNPGAHGVSLANYDFNDQPAVLAISRGALSPGSGGVVFIGDANVLVDSGDGGNFGDADNQALLLNSIRFAIPEPSMLALTAGAGIFLAARRRRCV